jgi:hypothetical protein
MPGGYYKPRTIQILKEWEARKLERGFALKSCPICGVLFEKHPGKHCKEGVYRGIDAAESRSEVGFPWADEMQRCWAERRAWCDQFITEDEP